MQKVQFKIQRRELFAIIPRTVAADTLIVSDLEKQFSLSEYRHCYLTPDIWEALPRLFSELKTKTTQDPISLSIGERRAASLSLKVSTDSMEAEATVEAPYGGSPLTNELILNQLRDAKITKGIRKSAIEALVAHTQEAPPGASFTVLIAKGKAAQNGENTLFKPLVEDARTRLLKPQAKDKHRVDLRDFGALVSVQAGTPILERVPYSLGTPGYTVTGEVVPASDGQDATLKAGSGTEIDANNPNLLLATVAGLPSFTNNSASVDDTLALKDVDVGTGHVDYDGSVIIDGNIAPSMRVTATGDITINGYIDSAIVRTSGNITVTKGVIGRQTEHEEMGAFEHTTQIVSDATIWLAYSQYATILAKDGVFVDKQLTHCRVVSDGPVHIGGEARKAVGKVIGGTLEISQDVYVGQLGAPAGTRTRIDFNVPRQSKEQVIAEENAISELKKLAVTKSKLLKAKAYFIQNPEAFEEHFKTELKKSFSQLEQKIKAAREHLIFVRENEIPVPPVKVHINKVMHVGAEFYFHGRVTRFDEPRGPCVIVLYEGQITVEPY